ncbi:MAG: excinuclease ABC subunit UvrA [Cyanobacteria bacterium TGS_CYA1]|nr:excinuclease ABC subunit UvrA [Cyanobacteria bacterium TGS_CYA1]
MTLYHTKNMSSSNSTSRKEDGFVEIKGAEQNNLRNISLRIPRDSFVVFTGISGSGKSSLAFGTLYAEAQRRYFESIAPYARRLLSQLPPPKVDEILGLPPAVALQQRRAEPNTRSSVGTITTISNGLRMLFSRAGKYPEEMDHVDSDYFSYNTQIGMCPKCLGLGQTHDITEESLVPNQELSIREGAIAAWPGAWQGKNLRDILDVLGYDVNKPWKKLSRKDREWILFTEEKPVVTVHAIREAHRIQRPYQGTYMSAAHYVRHTFASTQSSTLRKKAMQFMVARTCEECLGKRLRKESLAITFAGCDIFEMGKMPLKNLIQVLREAPELTNQSERSEVAKMIVHDLIERCTLISKLGLDYLALDRSTPTLSAGELQRLRLTSQLKSGLFGVVYVLDEPSAGLHPADAEALVDMLMMLKNSGNSLFVVEHELNIVRQADWIVDMGPEAGDKGGKLLYSGPIEGLLKIDSHTSDYLFDKKNKSETKTKTNRRPINPKDLIKLDKVTRHNLENLSVEFPKGVLTVVTGVSGSGKSTLVSQVLSDAIKSKFGLEQFEEREEVKDEDDEDLEPENLERENSNPANFSVSGLENIKRLVQVNQKPIGRTPRSNLATYTGLFDHIRKKFAETKESKARKYNVGRFSFNVKGGRCEHCEGEGFISIELLFLPSVFAPCNECKGKRYNEDTLQIKYQEKNIAEVLEMTVDKAHEFFKDLKMVERALKTLLDVGLGYLRLGQPATELSGGEAQRIKLATELQRQQQGDVIYLLDEPTTGLHPYDIERLMKQLQTLVDGKNTVIVVEHDMDVISQADWVIELGPGAGSDGGKVVAVGQPEIIASCKTSKTAPYLKKHLGL